MNAATELKFLDTRPRGEEETSRRRTRKVREGDQEEKRCRSSKGSRLWRKRNRFEYKERRNEITKTEGRKGKRMATATIR